MHENKPITVRSRLAARARQLVGGLACVLLSACGGGSGPAPYAGLASYVEAEQFVGTIIVRREGQTLLRASHGFADRERAVPNSPETRYPIASLTKAFTALQLVLLKGEDRIGGYDDPVSTILPDYPRGAELTLRHLLTHRSGIPDPTADADPGRPLAFAPGEAFDHSNANCILLGHLIETLGGQRWADDLQARVLDPLGLLDTGDGATRPESFADRRLVSEADLADIFGGERYGFGWVISELAGRRVHGHTGGIDGFSAILAIFPDQNAVVVALSNVENEQHKLNRMVATIAEHEL
jgi:D-alanyl-D-alanine carboxypeptidase